MRGWVTREEAMAMEIMSRSSSGGIVEMEAMVRSSDVRGNLFRWSRKIRGEIQWGTFRLRLVSYEYRLNRRVRPQPSSVVMRLSLVDQWGSRRSEAQENASLTDPGCERRFWYEWTDLCSDFVFHNPSTQQQEAFTSWREERPGQRAKEESQRFCLFGEI